MRDTLLTTLIHVAEGLNFHEEYNLLEMNGYVA